MTQEFWGNRPPDAPDSPQWWALSEALLRMDGLGEEYDLNTVEGWNAATKHVLDGLLDVETLSYAARQRAFRSAGVETYQDIQDKMHEVTLGMAAWLDGFVAATLAYERLKQLRDD